MTDAGDVVAYTIGHSTRPLEEFVSLLREYGIAKLIDIRTVPRSARNPQFNWDSLPGELARAGIAYEHLGALGGLRKPRRDSVNMAWKNESFRGYADYMGTEEFERALDHLINEAREQRVCIMCAEAVPWRCHRNLVSDALTARGGHAIHILSPGKSQPHAITRFARVRGGRVTYPVETLDFR